jgi:hypothetical protein
MKKNAEVPLLNQIYSSNEERKTSCNLSLFALRRNFKQSPDFSFFIRPQILPANEAISKILF